MHEHGETSLDTQLAPVYNRIAEFMLNTPIRGQQSIIPSIITQGGSLTGTRQGRDARLGDYYDRLNTESKAMQQYFALMKDPAPNAIENFLAGPWQKTHPAAQGAAPLATDVRRQMWEDYATLGAAVPADGPTGVTGFHSPPPLAKGEDRPFAPKGSPQDPGAGFLTIPREVVIGLGKTVTRWGAIDFGG